MRKQRNRVGVSSVLILGAMVHGACADAYRNPAPTAEGIAKSGANLIFSDDASAISYNPANLAFQTNASVVVAVAFPRAENTYAPAPGVDIVSDDPWAVLPNLYVSMPVANGIVAGLGITTPYGQGVSWNSSDLYNPLAPVSLYKAKIALVDFNPTVAMKIGDAVAVGVGADIFYSRLEFNALIPAPTPPFPPGTPPADAKAEGEGLGFGGNVALTWEMTERQSVALTYRSQVDVDYEGDFSLGGDFDMNVKYPNTVEVGYGIQATDTLQVEAMLQWSEWSINDVQTATAGVLGSIPLVNNWEDTITVAVGGSWQFAEGWVFRTGYSFIETPIPDSTVNPLLPDTDRHIVGVGLGYTIAGHTLDLSYAHTFYEEKTGPAGSAAPGTYDIDSNLVGVTYSRLF